MLSIVSRLIQPSRPQLLREKRALFSAVVAWRRAWLEVEHRRTGDLSFHEDLVSLRLYGHAAAFLDPFSDFVLGVDLGALDEPIELEAGYRIETAAGLAWGLRLAESLPDPSVGADVDALSSLFPLDAPSLLARARLRSRSELERERAAWTRRLVSARAALDALDAESQVTFSRCFERTRALTFLTSDHHFLEDVVLR